MSAQGVRVVNRMPQFVDAVQHRAARGILTGLVIGTSEAVSLTPQHTSNLVNSQYKRVEPEGAKIVGRMGYTAEYAMAVHEAPGTLKGQPRPIENNKPQGDYWDPRGEPEFLKKGFERAEPAIKRAIKAALKV